MPRARRSPSIYSQDDPLSSAIRPSNAETKLERKARLQREAEAKRISDAIDEQLEVDRIIHIKSQQDVRLLLLGQAESGKSTLQKQFQLMYSPDAVDNERDSWRMVIYFNVARSVKRILEYLYSHSDTFDGDVPDAHGPVHDSVASKKTIEDLIRDSKDTAGSCSSSIPPVLTEAQKQIATLRLRLSPLVATTPVMEGGNSRDVSEVVEEVGRILNASKEDIKALWRSDVVQKVINRRRLRLEEWAEYFLSAIDRVAAGGYIPSPDDILHARIQTMGVAEHQFEVPFLGRSVTWHLYDVCGARGQRHAWAPYFEEANAIIFVAPISAFDQYLDEDPRTNRIDDSLQLFTSICSNQLLKNVHLVLFFNKVDVLQSKLANGVRVNKYIKSFGNRPNDYESVVHYLRGHFLYIHRKNNENKRQIYSHLTNAMDIQTTRTIIVNVRDCMFRDHLKMANLV